MNCGPLTIRVQRVRRRTASSVTVTGIAIDDSGAALPRMPRFAATFLHRTTPGEVEQGQWWRVEGDAESVRYIVDGFEVFEKRLEVAVAHLMRPSGEHVVQLLSSSPAFPGIGEVKARRLWEALGEQLYECLEHGNCDALATVLGPDLASVAVTGWKTFAAADALRWFQTVGLDLRLSRKLMAVYGPDTLQAVAADPYRLLAFGMSWAAADRLATVHFNLGTADERRLSAAVESVLYAAFDAGHTWCERPVVAKALAKLISSSHVEAALALAESHRAIDVNGHRVHARGPHLVEQSVAQALELRLDSAEALTDTADLDALIERFEREESGTHGFDGFALNEAQRKAVHAVAMHPLVLITGGAGVGKTTVLKVIVEMLETAGRTAYLMALSGRAAKRMSEATQQPAMTIAGFLRNVAPTGVPENSVLVVDEASMLDILLCARLLKAVPDSCRLVFIGDPFQLPPVGPGLTLHALIAAERVPRVELTEVRRFGGDIARSAREVRDGQWPVLPSELSAPIAFWPVEASGVGNVVLEAFLVDPNRTQILTVTRTRGPASAMALNALCQSAMTSHAPSLLVWNSDRRRFEDSGLRQGDPVLCTRNLWEHGLQNGSLGRLEALELSVPGESFDADTDPVLGWVRWDDGELRPVTLAVLDALELGYAVTVHKAQGSQFPRVIVPICPARNLDRTMLYTAITRATTQVILIGDEMAACSAVHAPPLASRRNVSLAGLLQSRPSCL